MKFPNIEAERAKHRMTKGELCKALEISRVTYINWQNGKNRMAVEYIIKLAIMFGVSTDYLLERGQ